MKTSLASRLDVHKDGMYIGVVDGTRTKEAQMATTKSGEKATELRGSKHFWLLQPPNGRRFAVIEAKPSANIENIDTRIVERSPNETWEERISASKFTPDGADHASWFVNLPGSNCVGPYATKAEALRVIRDDALPNLHRHF